MESRSNIELPFDVIINIISKLAVKSLGRFKCVCKSWSDVINGRNFIEMHMKSCSKAFNVYNNKTVIVLDVKDGLLLEQNVAINKYFLSNRVTKEIITIPQPHKEARHMTFSYIRSTGYYKLVHIYGKSGNKAGGCMFLNIGIDLQWRNVDIPFLHSFHDDREKSICWIENEACLFFRFFKEDSQLSKILYIEMEGEHFNHIEFPKGLLLTGWTNVDFVKCENKPAVIDMVKHELHIWVLEDYKRQKWADHKIVVSLSFLTNHPHLELPWPCLSVTGGWISYVHNKYNIVVYNIKSKVLQISFATGSDQVYQGRCFSSLVSIHARRKEECAVRKARRST